MKNVHKRKYLTIRVCTGHTEVGYSSPLIYYELLIKPFIANASQLEAHEHPSKDMR